ncbi:MAG: hypothetical protein LBK59_04610 [Bifidobacteriaceae bacterium]|jgi:hypothetical protein|nr:hypothetical protein [Bifidobacteriaceae bacterium]
MDPNHTRGTQYARRASILLAVTAIALGPDDTVRASSNPGERLGLEVGTGWRLIPLEDWCTAGLSIE